jgi:hypothetical protein
MTDDIVTRLRKHHEWFGNGGQPTSIWEDAADEIERLRATIKWFEHISVCRKYGKEECWECVTPENRKTIMEVMLRGD